MARDAISSLISSDEDIRAYTVSGGHLRVFGSSATDTPIRTDLFAVVTYGIEEPSFGTVAVSNVTVWVHMPKEIERSYRRVDPILDRIISLMAEATQVHGADGYVLSSASPRGKSADLYDDGYQTLTKSALFRVASYYVGYVVTG